MFKATGNCPYIPTLFLWLLIGLLRCPVTAQQKTIDSLYSLINKATSDTQRINLLLKVANNHRFSEPDSCLYLAGKALMESRSHKYIQGEGYALHTLGVAQDALGNYDSAIYYFRSSLKVFEKEKFKKGKAAALLSIGGYYYYKSDFIQAADFMLQSLRIAEEIVDKESMASACNNLGAVYTDRKDYNQALLYFKRALQLKKELNQHKALATTYINIGNIYSDLEKNDSSLYWYNLALENATQFSNKRTVASAKTNIGTIYFKQDKYTEALTEFEQALQMDMERKDAEGIAVNQLNIGHVFIKQKKYRQGIPLLKDALAGIQKLNFKYHEQNALKFLAEAYAATGDNAGAYNYLLQYIAVHDSVYTQESNQRIAEMQTLYETEKKDKQISLLEKEKEVQQKTNLFLIAAAILVSLLLLVVFSRYRYKQRTNRLLAEKNIELQRLNATKDKLFAIVAHDLKNPLSAFRSITQNLVENSLHISKEEIEQFIGRLNQSANQLYDLLQNLLNWAISQIGKLPFAPEKFVIREIADENVRLFQTNLQQKNQAIEINIEPGLYVLADRNMIKTVIRNLLSNAVKFTGAGGKITLLAKPAGHEIVFTVADNGSGMQEAELAKLFKIEEDVTTVGNNPEKGTGIGLILCKELMEKNNGRIWAESTPGQGSRFHFALPAA